MEQPGVLGSGLPLGQLSDLIAGVHQRTVCEWLNGQPIAICAECHQHWPCRTVELLGQYASKEESVAEP